MLEWIFSGRALVDTRYRRMVLSGSENPHLFNRRFTHMARVAIVKMPRLLAFARHVEIAIITAQKPRSATLMGSQTLLVTTGTLENLEKNPPCNAEDNLRAGLIAIEAWFGGY